MRPVQTALVLSGILAAYLGVGIIFGGADDSKGDHGNANNTFAVQYKDQTAQDFVRKVSIRGHTEALRHVQIKAEVEGRVLETPVEKGTRVKKGDLICRLETREREARLAEARALLKQRTMEYEAAQSLSKQGHRSETQTAAAKALMDAAIANEERYELDLNNTSVRAPFDGLIDDRAAEVGAFLQKGGACATIMSEDPFLVVGEISEAYVGFVKPKSSASVTLANGEVRRGHVRFLAGTANEKTRAFRIEIELENTDHTLRDGLSATINLELDTIRAHFVPSSVLVLDTNGILGIRTIADDNSVVFYPVDIIDDDLRGIWLTGLPESVKMITVGQNFVADGEKVRTFKAEG